MRVCPPDHGNSFWGCGVEIDVPLHRSSPSSPKSFRASEAPQVIPSERSTPGHSERAKHPRSFRASAAPQVIPSERSESRNPAVALPVNGVGDTASDSSTPGLRPSPRNDTVEGLRPSPRNDAVEGLPPSARNDTVAGLGPSLGIDTGRSASWMPFAAPPPGSAAPRAALLPGLPPDGLQARCGDPRNPHRSARFAFRRWLMRGSVPDHAARRTAHGLIDRFRCASRFGPSLPPSSTVPLS
jgi:hypothetical protein